MPLPLATETTETDVEALSPPVGGAPPETAEIEYPEGNWIAQSVAHSDASSLAKAALRLHFQHRDDALVAMELMVYYQRGNVSARLQPDVLVAFGVRQPARRSTFKVWEEGKAPDFVLEVASPSTAGRDARHKALEYGRIGVREYWRLDPHGSLMEKPLEGYEAQGGRYSPLRPVASPSGAGWLRSRVLGLDLRSRTEERGTTVVFRDPETGKEFDGALEEAERRRQAAEDRADSEAERADAESEGRRGAEELAIKEAERANREAERRQAAEKRSAKDAERRRAAEKRSAKDAERRRAAEKRSAKDVERANREAKGRRAAERRVRALEEQLKNLATNGPAQEFES